MMKTALTSSVLVALFAANAGANTGPVANYVTTAATGSKATATVHFTGEIVASTCVVSTANQPGKTVALPQVTNQLFSGAGSSTGDTPFTLQFSGCSGVTGGSGYVVVFTGKTLAVIQHFWKRNVARLLPPMLASKWIKRVMPSISLPVVMR